MILIFIYLFFICIQITKCFIFETSTFYKFYLDFLGKVLRGVKLHLIQKRVVRGWLDDAWTVLPDVEDVGLRSSEYAVARNSMELVWV
uniref:Putative secreted protein n=1 Tax=Xenopsylla cheopis TaxID=163159 RepID=A0A6M2DVD0_XENCH